MSLFKQLVILKKNESEENDGVYSFNFERGLKNIKSYKIKSCNVKHATTTISTTDNAVEENLSSDLNTIVNGNIFWINNIFTPPVSNGWMDADIGNISTIKIWLDFENTSKILDATYSPVQNVGDNVLNIINITLPALTYIISLNTAIQWVNIGQTKGIAEDNQPQSTVVSDVDSNNPIEVLNSTLHILFKSCPTNSLSYLYESRFFKIREQFNVLQFKNISNQTINTNIAMTPNTDYYLRIVRTEVSSGDTYDWTLIKMSDLTQQTDSTVAGLDSVSQSQATFYLSGNNSDFNHVLSHVIYQEGFLASEMNNIYLWMKARYEGVSTSSSTSGAKNKYFQSKNNDGWKMKFITYNTPATDKTNLIEIGNSISHPIFSNLTGTQNNNEFETTFSKLKLDYNYEANSNWNAILYEKSSTLNTITNTSTAIFVGANCNIRMSYIMYDPQNNIVLNVENCRPVSTHYHHSGAFYDSTDATQPAFHSSIEGGILWMQTGNGDISTTGDRGLFIDQFGGTSFGYSTILYSGAIECNLFNTSINTVPVPRHHVSWTYNANNYAGFDMSNDIISPTNTDDVNNLKFPKNNYPNYFQISSNNPNGYYIRITYNNYTEPQTTTYSLTSTTTNTNEPTLFMHSKRLTEHTKNNNLNGNGKITDVISHLTTIKNDDNDRHKLYDHTPIYNLDFYFTDSEDNSDTKILLDNFQIVLDIEGKTNKQ